MNSIYGKVSIKIFSYFLSILDAVKMLKFYIKNPEKITESERHHYGNVATSDVFIEAIPTLFIQICILLTILGKHKLQANFELDEIVGSPYIFLISFTSSILTSSFGVAR